LEVCLSDLHRLQGFRSINQSRFVVVQVFRTLADARPRALEEVKFARCLCPSRQIIARVVSVVNLPFVP